MKFTTNFLITVVLFFGVLINSSAQTKTEYRMASLSLSGNLKEFDTATGQCGASTYSIGENSVLEVIRPINSGEDYVVQVYLKTSSESDAVDFDRTYCISKADLYDNNYFRKYSKIDYGVLAVPYKMRFAPFSFFPGGTLGGYVGRKINLKNFQSSFVFHGGLSAIPLNNINSDIVDVKLGFTGGLGWIWYVDKDFQIGLVTGIDLFDGVNQWTYKYQPWLSFNIGYSFSSK
jgi:hypothetical protein